MSARTWQIKGWPVWVFIGIPWAVGTAQLVAWCVQGATS